MMTIKRKPLILCLVILFAGCVRYSPELKPEAEVETVASTNGKTTIEKQDLKLNVKTYDGLEICFSNDGKVRSMNVDDSSLSLAGDGGFSIKEVESPTGNVQSPAEFSTKTFQTGFHLRMRGYSEKQELQYEADFREKESYIDVQGHIQNNRETDRAFLVSFTLPVNLNGWEAQNTLFDRDTIATDTVSPSGKNSVLYLGKKDGDFRNYDPRRYPIEINKLPFSTVVSDKTGLAIGVPLNQPQVFSIKASEKGYSITFSLGISPDTEKFPNQASFHFVIYQVDPAWGLRSAAERYYSFFPEMFEGAENKHGNFGFFFIDRLGDQPEDFGWAFLENDFQWYGGEMTREQARVAEELDLTIAHWRNPLGWHPPKGENTIASSNATPQDCLNTLKAWAQGKQNADIRRAHSQNCGVRLQKNAQAALNSYLINEEGLFMRGTYGTYWVFPMNLDPDLPSPNRFDIAVNYQYRYIKNWDKPQYRGPFTFAWDAVDDFTGFRRLNFRREHFRYTDVPLTFDPDTGRLCQIKGFHDWEFARDHSKMVHEKGGKIMANVTIEHSMMYLGQFIDIFISERKIANHDLERLSVMRMLMRHKPLSFIASWQPDDEKGLRKAFQKSLFYGMAPGADGGRGDEKRQAVERKIFKSGMPVLSAIGAAGWQPMTHARSEDLLVERFGDNPGNLYFTVRNPAERKIDGRVKINLKELNLKKSGQKIKIDEILNHKSVETTMQQNHLVCDIFVDPDETCVLRLSTCQ